VEAGEVPPYKARYCCGAVGWRGGQTPLHRRSRVVLVLLVMLFFFSRWGLVLLYLILVHPFEDIGADCNTTHR
jgi:hypothetical protein